MNIQTTNPAINPHPSPRAPSTQMPRPGVGILHGPHPMCMPCTGIRGRWCRAPAAPTETKRMRKEAWRRLSSPQHVIRGRVRCWSSPHILSSLSAVRCEYQGEERRLGTYHGLHVLPLLRGIHPASSTIAHWDKDDGISLWWGRRRGTS